MRKRLIILFIAAVIIMTCAFRWALPEVNVPQPSVVYDINGRSINGLTQQNQISVSLDQISPYFLKAIIAVEDKNFYHHHGIDLIGVLRALIVNIKAGHVVEGGSTITQQTAKNLFLGNERTLGRKLRELYYTFELERKYSKDEILALYCNTIYFGEGAYGIEAASRQYFAKSASQLDVAEAALLAGIPRSPALYDPYQHPQQAGKRQAVVLQRMLEDKKISAEAKTMATAEKLNYQRGKYAAGDAPYFIAMVKDYLIKKYGERMVFQGGLNVYTSLDLDMQKAANQAMDNGTKGWDANLQAALIALDVRNGQIRALVGGRNFMASSYNRVLSYRQPGSTFKPFMYSLALEQGFTEASMVKCQKYQYDLPSGETYVPADYGSTPYHDKDFTLKEAVMISDNVIAVQVNDILGPENTARHAGKFGFSNIRPVLSLPLGASEVRPLDLAAGYAVFADQGVYHRPYYLLKIVDNRGRTLEDNKSQSQSRRVITPQNAYLVTDMLKGVLEPGGTGSNLKNLVQRPAGGKTGTTDQSKDAWFAGYTPYLCCAVWVGYDQARSANLTGSAYAGPIWANFLREASSQIPAVDFTIPSGINVETICLDTGLVATDACPRPMSMAFLDGTEPQDICYYHATGLDKWTSAINNLFNR